ncbi:hypothetical protein JW960_14830 [candidate division KSB1 bacterium]|nr:hypothetical protein [candidate division KSB1 bacterium]
MDLLKVFLIILQICFLFLFFISYMINADIAHHDVTEMLCYQADGSDPTPPPPTPPPPPPAAFNV